ncbi:hypothetical protein FRB96_005357 [Tulasnella sp. 330]|nr:hypothetical protein FRB96_005357 [Tulasnella sp. 330]
MPRKIAAKAPSQQNIPGPTSGRQVNPSEVGWQFVPQYYTFMNKHPHRLHCFYTKNSTFINGTEGEDGKACHEDTAGEEEEEDETVINEPPVAPANAAAAEGPSRYVEQLPSPTASATAPIEPVVDSYESEAPAPQPVPTPVAVVERQATPAPPAPQAVEEEHPHTNGMNGHVDHAESSIGEEDKSELAVPAVAEPEPEPVEPIAAVMESPSASEVVVPTVKAPSPVPSIAAAPTPPPAAAATPQGWAVAPPVAVAPTPPPAAATPQAPPAPSGRKTWAMLAASNNGGWAVAPPVAVAPTPPPAAATPQAPPAPSGRKTWARLAASNNGGWAVAPPVAVAPTPPPAAATPQAPPAPSGRKTWARLAASNNGGWAVAPPVAVAPTPPPAAATPQAPPAPFGRKTWAILAASNNRKWGNQIATDAKSVNAAGPQSPAPSPAPQMPAAGPDTTPKGPVEVTTSQCFVKAVTDNVTEAVLKETLISRFGPVKELEIIRSKACAFLEFASPEAAQKAITVSLPVPQGGEGGIRLEGKLGPNGMRPRVIIEAREERGEIRLDGPGGEQLSGIRLWGMLGRGGSSPIVETSKEEPERPIATREWGGPLSDEGRENAAAG